MPLGIRSKDAQLVIAYGALEDVLLGNAVSTRELPPALYNHLNDECARKVRLYLEGLRKNLLNVMYGDLFRVGIHVPMQTMFEEATFQTSVDWDISNLCASPGQPHASVIEQRKALPQGKTIIDKYRRGYSGFIKSLLLMGVAGSGKTTLQECIGLYALGQGLSVLAVSLTAERANQIGGVHAHKLFCFGVKKYIGAGKMAETAWVKLLTRPENFEAIHRVDVLLWDELLNCSDYFIHAVDMLFRMVKRNSRFMLGGVLLVGTGDRKQTQPIDGRPLLTSPLVIANFLMHELENPVRASGDLPLQRIQAMRRLPASAWSNNATCTEFGKLIGENCTFVDDIYNDRVPSNAVYVFSKCVPCRKAEAHILRRMKDKYPLQFVSREPFDTEKSMTQNESCAASPSTVVLLNSKANEPKHLGFYPFAHYEVTFNDPGGNFFHSQIAMVLEELPSEEDLTIWKPIDIYIAPAGVKTFPANGVSKPQLYSMGGKRVQIGKSRENVYHLGFRGLTAKRQQYGLKPRIATTIHGLQGDTVTAIVTKITGNDGLWESGQGTVLLS